MYNTRPSHECILCCSVMSPYRFCNNNIIFLFPQSDIWSCESGNSFLHILLFPGIFTAPRSGVYSFSFSIYSKVGGKGERMYYKVQLMRNREVVASTWEDNREDSEDSSSQTVLLSLQQGGQVYVELLSGRQLCGITEGLNTFSGSLIYSTQAEYWCISLWSNICRVQSWCVFTIFSST